MKKILTLLGALLVLNAAAREVAPPKYQGAAVDHFMSRLIGETQKVAVAQNVPAAELSSQVVVAFKIDTAGVLSEWRFLDNTCEGRDRVDAEPATPRTREVMTAALARLDGAWTSARQDGLPTPYTWRLTLRVPVEKIAKAQDTDPLLFMGEDPDKSFHPWAKSRIHYDGRYLGRAAGGVEGIVQVRFYIEPNGNIAIGDVMKTPDDKLAKEVIRVIRSSKGKWTPRFVSGVAQRTVYIYSIDFSLGNTEYETEE